MTEDKKEVKEKKCGTYKKKCGTCKHLSPCKNSQVVPERTECRCHPPQVVLVKDQRTSVWPEVEDEDWCGQWAEGKQQVKPGTKREAGMW